MAHKVICNENKYQLELPAIYVKDAFSKTCELCEAEGTNIYYETSNLLSIKKCVTYFYSKGHIYVQYLHTTLSFF